MSNLPEASVGQRSGQAPRLRLGFTLVELLVDWDHHTAPGDPASGAGPRAPGGKGGHLLQQRQATHGCFPHVCPRSRGRLPGNYWDGLNPERDKRSWLNNYNEVWTNAPQGGT